jgi:hypothetical protein
MTGSKIGTATPPPVAPLLGGAGLPHRLGGAIELTERIGEPACHCENAAGFVLQHHHRAPPDSSFAYFFEISGGKTASPDRAVDGSPASEHEKISTEKVRNNLGKLHLMCAAGTSDGSVARGLLAALRAAPAA